MVIDMNEVQVRTLEQVREVVAGTQALDFRPGGDDAARYANSTFKRPCEPHALLPAARQPRADAPHGQPSAPDSPATPARQRSMAPASPVITRAPIVERDTPRPAPATPAQGVRCSVR